MRANGFVRLCEVSLSSDQPIMLALKKFISCYAVALCIKTHSALLAAWIESNILLQLASATHLSYRPVYIQNNVLPTKLFTDNAASRARTLLC